MHQNKIVFFYIVMVLGLSFFVLFSTGMIPYKLPQMRLTKSTPDLTFNKIWTLYGLEKYDAIASDSLVEKKDGYRVITEEDLGGVNSERYVSEAKDLCRWINVHRKIEKKQISDIVWEYKFYTGFLYDASRTYEIHLSDDGWKFVLTVDEN